MKGPRSKFAGGGAARYLLLGSTVFLTLTGLVMIFSAASVADFVHYDGNSYHSLERQAMWVLAGTIAAALLARLDYRWLKRVSMTLWGIAVSLLGVVFVLGVAHLGARRWLEIGSFGNLQPSEFAKIVCVLVVAVAAVDWHRGKMTESQLLGRTVILAGIPAAMILSQPDLGTMLTLAIGVVAVLFLAGVRYRWMAAAFGLAAIIGAAAIALEPFRLQRFTSYLNPYDAPLKSGYQIIQAMYAFGTGGFTGVGLGLSRQKFFYLPAAHTDFILAIIGEELGLAGTLAVVVAFIVFAYAGFRIALGAKDTLGRLLAGGLTAMIVAQAIINMGAVTGLLPITGKPLPFVSFGGSSLLFTMACVGALLSVSRYSLASPRAGTRSDSGTRFSDEEKEYARAIPTERRRDSRARVSGPVSGRGVARRRA